MGLNITRILRPLFSRRVFLCERFSEYADEIQASELGGLLGSAAKTEIGRKYNFRDISSYEDFKNRVPLHCYEDLKPLILRTVAGEKDILWPGKVRNFAQSSGTSDGRSKYIPITRDSFNKCHYQGGFDCVAHYLNLNPDSRIFSGKSFILGGSFANQMNNCPNGTRIGDLSANLIQNINPLANLVRIPSKEIALMEDWTKKLPALVKASINSNITNISGVPSWFLSVIKQILKEKGVSSIHEVWPNLEVFFHGGISFEPYKSQYESICDMSKMHFLETYNASEGFFAVQNSWDSKAMLLLLDLGVFYEFRAVNNPDAEPIPIWEIEQGKTYELIITANNGLWRYAIGDTVYIESLNPVKIRIAGRTKHFINAFGEELMVHNADAAIAATCAATGVQILNYTAAPVYSTPTSKGRHQWLIEFNGQISDEKLNIFAKMLDENLRKVNSDYDAKRTGDLFIEPLSITRARNHLFDDWLVLRTGRLGGQKKVPRLSNNREIIESMLELNK